MAAGRAPQASIAARTPGCLCAGRLSMTTMSPGLSVGTSMASTQARKAGPSMAPSMVIGASIPETRSPPTNVVVFQCPCGTAATHRAPRRARPQRRAILVEAPVSSTTTRRPGSRSACAARQVSRRATTSGRSRSLACAVFFEGLVVAIEATPDRARRETLAAPHLDVGRDLGERDIAVRLDQRQDLRGVRLDAARSLVAALRSRRDRAALAPPLRPLHRRRGGDTEPTRRSAAGRAPGNRCNQALTQIVRKRLGHAGWPPPPAPSMNHCSRRKGIPRDSARWENALASRRPKFGAPRGVARMSQPFDPELIAQAADLLA